MTGSKAKWPLVSKPIRDQIAAIIDAAANEAIDEFDRMPHEERLTGHFFGLLASIEKLRVRKHSTVSFQYETFGNASEQTIGADGAIIISARLDGRTHRKLLLVQAKRLPGNASRTRLRIPNGKDRDRLFRQLDDLYDVAGAGGSIGLFYTRYGFFGVDAGTLLDLADTDPSVLATPLLRRCHPWPIGRLVADLALRCKVGSTSPTILREMEKDGLKGYARRRRSLRHVLTIGVRSTKSLPATDAQIEEAQERMATTSADSGDSTTSAPEPLDTASATTPRKALPAPAYRTYFDRAVERETEVPVRQSLEEVLSKLLKK